MKRVSIINYMGWEVHLLENKLLRLYLAPQLGGRILQLEMNSHEYLFVNKQLAGIQYNNIGGGDNKTWLNFGGEKIWPAPQGWDNNSQWPGPPDKVLDGGVYSIQTKAVRNGSMSATLQSPTDDYTGLQIIRDISIVPNKTEVEIKVKFHNTTNIPKKWSIWSVCQVKTPRVSPDGLYYIICPTAAHSQYDNGYKIMHGLANNPQYQLNSRQQLTVNYKYLVGKVGLDTDSGWLAYLDKMSGKVLVYKFDIQEHQEYPENTSVQIWSQGIGSIYSRNKITQFENNETLNPPYMEMEILSPLITIPPKGSMEFNYYLFTSTISGLEGIKTINKFGIVVCSFRILVDLKHINIDAKYGVFLDGVLKIQIGNVQNGNTAKLRDLYKCCVSPLKGIEIKLSFAKTKFDFQKEHTILANLFHKDNTYYGTIDEIKI